MTVDNKQKMSPPVGISLDFTHTRQNLENPAMPAQPEEGAIICN